MTVGQEGVSRVSFFACLYNLSAVIHHCQEIDRHTFPFSAQDVWVSGSDFTSCSEDIHPTKSIAGLETATGKLLCASGKKADSLCEMFSFFLTDEILMTASLAIKDGIFFCPSSHSSMSSD